MNFIIWLGGGGITLFWLILNLQWCNAACVKGENVVIWVYVLKIMTYAILTPRLVILFGQNY